MAWRRGAAQRRRGGKRESSSVVASWVVAVVARSCRCRVLASAERRRKYKKRKEAEKITAECAQANDLAIKISSITAKPKTASRRASDSALNQETKKMATKKPNSASRRASTGSNVTSMTKMHQKVTPESIIPSPINAKSDKKMWTDL